MDVEEFLNLKVDIKSRDEFISRNCILANLIENTVLDIEQSNADYSIFQGISIQEASHTFLEYREDDYPESDIFSKYGVVVEDRYDFIMRFKYLDNEYKYININNELVELNEPESITMFNHYLEETYNEKYAVLVID